MKKLHGTGLGFRPDFYNDALNAPRDAVDWYEVVSENFMGGGGRPHRFLKLCRESFPLSIHGVALSIASVEPIRDRYLKSLAKLVREIDPIYVSDHLCWTSHGGVNSHDLLPLPYTESHLRRIVEKLDLIQNTLGRRFYLENPSAYVAFQYNEYSEADFLKELIKRSGCGILLDINNLYVNHRNLGYDAVNYLNRFVADDICYFHLAGHSVNDEVIIDTHDHPVCDDVWQLYRFALTLFPEMPVMIERDGNIPPFQTLLEEVDVARRHAARAKKENEPSAFGSSETQLGQGLAKEDRAIHAEFLGLVRDLSPCSHSDLTLLSSDSPTPRDVGVSVYNSAFFARLRDTLKAIYPTLSKIFTEDAFHDLACLYLDQMPPEDWSISRIGARFPLFLLEGKWDGDTGVTRKSLSDIAKIEWQIERLYDVPDEVGIPLESLGTVAEEDWEHVAFRLSDTWSIVPTQYSVKDVIKSVRDGRKPDRPREGECHYIVFRKDEELYWDEIPEEEALFISLLKTGASFFDATARLAEKRASSCEETLPDSLTYLKELFNRQCISAILGQGSTHKVAEH